MAWNTPVTLVPGYVVTDTDWNNYVRDNPNYLYAGRPLGNVSVRNAAYTTTSATFVDVDATNLKISTTLGGTRARLDFVFCALNNGGAGTPFVALSAILDSLTMPDNHNTTYGVGIGGGQAMLYSAYWSGITPGSHVFKLQWRWAGTGGNAYNTSAGVWSQLSSMALWEY